MHFAPRNLALKAALHILGTVNAHVWPVVGPPQQMQHFFTPNMLVLDVHLLHQ